MLFPIFLLVFRDGFQHVDERSIIPLDLPVTHGVIRRSIGRTDTCEFVQTPEQVAVKFGPPIVMDSFGKPELQDKIIEKFVCGSLT